MSQAFVATPGQTVGQLVDRLGVLKASMAAAKDEAESIEKFLKELGAGRYSGTMFDSVVSESERTTTDWKAVAAKLEPSRQLVTAHTSTAAVTMIRTTARKVSA